MRDRDLLKGDKADTPPIYECASQQDQENPDPIPAIQFHGLTVSRGTDIQVSRACLPGLGDIEKFIQAIEKKLSPLFHEQPKIFNFIELDIGGNALLL